MASNPRSTLQNSYGSSGTQFPDNTSQLITPAIERQFGQDLTDSHFNLNDDKYTGANGVYLGSVTDTTGLKALTTVGVSVNIMVFFRSSGGSLNVYKLISGTDAESLPGVARPNDYDGSTNAKVWKIANPISSDLLTTDTNFFEQTDFIVQTLSGMLGFNSTQSGAGASGFTISTDGATTYHTIGVAEQSTGTTNAGYGILYKAESSFYFGNGNTLLMSFRARIQQLSTGGDTFTIYIGFGTTANGVDFTDGAYFRYTHSVNSGKFECVTANGSTRTATDSGITVNTAYHIFSISVNSAGTSVSFSIDGVVVATNTTNIPTANTTGIIFKIVKSVGTIACKMNEDWYQLSITRTSAR